MKEFVEILIVALVIGFFVWLSIHMIGCGAEARSTIEGEGNTAKTDASATDDGSAKADSVEGNQNVKVINTSPWPYVTIILAILVLGVGYLWFSKNYHGFGRT